MTESPNIYDNKGNFGSFRSAENLPQGILVSLKTQSKGVVVKSQGFEPDPILHHVTHSIYINDRKFADGVSDRHFTVPAYGESVIEVSLTSSLFRLIEQFQKLDQRGRLVLDYRLSGRISIAGAASRYAFDHEDTLDLSPPTGGGTAL